MGDEGRNPQMLDFVQAYPEIGTNSIHVYVSETSSLNHASWSADSITLSTLGSRNGTAIKGSFSPMSNQSTRVNYNKWTLIKYLS